MQVTQKNESPRLADKIPVAGRFVATPGASNATGILSASLTIGHLSLILDAHNVTIF